MKRTPLLTPPPDESKSLRITYRRSIPTRDEGSIGDIVIDVNDTDRYFKTPRGWEDANFGPLRVFIDSQVVRDSGSVATGKFRKYAIKRACERLLATMRATGTVSCHYENGDLCNGWAK